MTTLRLDAPVATTGPTTPSTHIRGDIQGMRAIAVALVVVFHFWPQRLPGGFIGVDVFFVISGFLITGHLIRELEQTGTIRLSRFYARRIRRLLPAAILVLAVTVAVSLVILPSSQLLETLRQAAASASYIENWTLAASSVDYMAQDAAPTPVQHYWSLSVEEQFYFIWPGLILLTAWFVRRRRAGAHRQAVLAMLVLLGAVSLIASIVFTGLDRASAYFITPTRIWEFVIGGLLVFIPTLGIANAYRAAAAWLGLILIGVSAVTMSEASAFPGIIAVFPVVGTALVIWGGQAATRGWWPGRWLGARPLRFIGDSSYAIYLWHWPVIVMLPIVLGGLPNAWQKVLAIAAVVGVSWLSTNWFEAPVRRARWLNSRLAPFALALVSALLFWGIWGATSARMTAEANAAAEHAHSQVGTPCYGANALRDACTPVSGDPTTVDPALAAADAQNPEYTRCDQRLDESDLVVCGFGPEDADTRIAIVGDSHATQWLGALAWIAEERGWHVDTYLKSSCPLTTATRVLDGEPASRAENCVTWQAQVRTALQSADLDAVLVSAYARGYQWSAEPGGELAPQAGVDGFAAEWADLTAHVAPVIVLADTPFLGGVNVPDCVATAAQPIDCSALRSAAVVPDALTAAVAQVNSPDVDLLDLSDLFCDAERCLAVVGGEIVYRDSSHLTWNYAASTAPELARRLTELEIE